MTTPRLVVLRGAALAVSLAAVALFGLHAAEAQVRTSLHDFSTGLYPRNDKKSGVCSHCHIPHGAQPNSRLWPFSPGDNNTLSEENTAYGQQLSNPNYAPGYTILCYDCHDSHKVGAPYADDYPSDQSFNANRKPQDVVFDLNMKTPSPPNNRDGLARDGVPGYFENVPSGKIGYPNISDPASIVSGHYVKNPPGGGGISQGDKLPCRDCHDPHDTSNAAFIRRVIGGRTLTGAGASMNMAYDTNGGEISGHRNNDESREFCIRCHGTSNQTTGVSALTFSDIRSGYGSNTIQIPPTTVRAHDSSQTAACTNCHYHNRIIASCSDCHGFPPLLATDFNASTNKYGQSYSGGAGAHRRHFDALGAGIFACEICHGPDVGSAGWHNQGNGTVLQANIDIMGQTSWWGPGSSYYGVDGTSTLPSDYEFEKKGGGDQVCAQLACHGYPAGTSGDAGALNWTDNMVQDGGETDSFDIEVCHWCHDSTPAVIDKDGTGSTYGPVKAPNIMGAGSGTAAWGAEVNGHGLASGNYEGNTVGEGTKTGRPAANKQCTVCHDGTYTAGTVGASYTPGSADVPHFDGSYNSAYSVPVPNPKRLNGTINGVTLANEIPGNGTLSDAACIACHQRTTGSDDGLQISSHGNTSNREGIAYPRLETEFQVLCRACHEPHGRNWNGTTTNTRNLHMVGAWLDSTSSGTWGATDGGTPGEDARVDSDLATQATAPAVSITSADNKVVFTSRTGTNSFDEGYGVAYSAAEDADDICGTCHSDSTRGGDHSNTPMNAGDQRESNCTTCHDHDYDDTLTYPWDAFLPFGAPDMEQFFDGVSSGSNYNVVSGHALDTTAPLTYSVPPDCIGCHQATGGAGVSNECLKCHFEGYVSGSTWVWSGHANGSQTLELRTPAIPSLGLSASPYSATSAYTAACTPGTNCISVPRRRFATETDVNASADVYPHCLTCHDHNQGASPGAAFQLDGQLPVDIVSASPSGRNWTTSSIGHGSTASLSGGRAGAPAYDCGACHASSVAVNADSRTPPPSYHASINEKLVANITSPYQTVEYGTLEQKNTWCATRCHRRAGGATKDNQVVDHTWAPAAATPESSDQSGCPMTDFAAGKCDTHPSLAVIDTLSTVNPLKLPASLPYDVLTNTFICHGCHEPHGNSSVTSAEGQMIRMNYSDGALCQECHL